MKPEEKVNVFIEALKVLTDERDSKEREEVRKLMANELRIISYK